MSGARDTYDAAMAEPQPPPGYRWWRTGDDEHPPPVLHDDARYGLIGEFLDVIEPQTEASGAVIGANLVTQLGTIIGRRAVVEIGLHRHFPNLFTLIVGETSIGAKGTGDTAAGELMRYVEPNFITRFAAGGFGSGEALIDEIRDRDEPTEKRRQIEEAEFSAVIKVGRRESSILSEIIRKGFDYKPIRHRTKANGHVIATGHHLAIVGSITPTEFTQLSGEVDVANGWLNRFLLIHARMSQTLAFGGYVPSTAVTPISDSIVANLKRLDEPRRYLIRRGTDTGDLWEQWYHRVRPGSGATPFMRSLTSRQHAIAPRVALVQAVINGADEIEPEHLASAMAWTDYSVGTAEMLFHGRASGPAGKLLDAIRAAGESGLPVKEQHVIFGRHATAATLDELRRQLVAEHQVATYSIPTAGRPRDVSIAITPCEQSQKANKGQ